MKNNNPTNHTCFFFSIFLEMSLFPGIFVSFPLSLRIGEYVVRSFLPDGVFLSCDHGLDFFTSAYFLCENSINQSINLRLRIP